jgi:hypothetical protein
METKEKTKKVRKGINIDWNFWVAVLIGFAIGFFLVGPILFKALGLK